MNIETTSLCAPPAGAPLPDNSLDPALFSASAAPALLAADVLFRTSQPDANGSLSTKLSHESLGDFLAAAVSPGGRLQKKQTEVPLAIKPIVTDDIDDPAEARRKVEEPQEMLVREGLSRR